MGAGRTICRHAKIVDGGVRYGDEKDGCRRVRGGGRKEKTGEAAQARIDKQLVEHGVIERRQKRELLSIVSELFCEGCTDGEIRARVLEGYPKTYSDLLQGENLWDLLRMAAREKLFRHTPRRRCADTEA